MPEAKTVGPKGEIQKLQPKSVSQFLNDYQFSGAQQETEQQRPSDMEAQGERKSEIIKTLVGLCNSSETTLTPLQQNFLKLALDSTIRSTYLQEHNKLGILTIATYINSLRS